MKEGRPLKFESVAELDEKIIEYKAYVNEKQVPMTLERLACFLNCNSELLREYGRNKEEFSETIKKIRNEIKADKLERLNAGKGSPAGIIFDVKNNHGYRDKQEITQHHTGSLSLGKAFENLKDDKDN